MSDIALLTSILLGFGYFSIADTYLRALNAEEEHIPMTALSTGAGASLAGAAVQLLTGVSAVIAAFCLALGFTFALAVLGRRGAARWRGRR